MAGKRTKKLVGRAGIGIGLTMVIFATWNIGLLVLPTGLKNHAAEYLRLPVNTDLDVLNGRCQIIEDRPVVSQPPFGSVKGVILLFPGCYHSALDFWPPGEHCPGCKGLPEEVNVLSTALEHGLFAIAVSSTNTCWDLANGDIASSLDLGRLLLTLKDLLHEESLENLPLFAFGASSGGVFTTLLPHVIALSGIIVQIAAAPDLKILENQRTKIGLYPPTAFVHMPRDRRTAELVSKNVRFLDKQGTPVIEFLCKPKRLEPLFFNKLDRSVSVEQSVKIFEAMRKGELLSRDGVVVSNPRESNWREVLEEAVPDVAREDGFKADESAISELLNVAYAAHELTSQHVSAAIDFISTRS